MFFTVQSFPTTAAHCSFLSQHSGTHWCVYNGALYQALIHTLYWLVDTFSVGSALHTETSILNIDRLILQGLGVIHISYCVVRRFPPRPHCYFRRNTSGHGVPSVSRDVSNPVARNKSCHHTFLRTTDMLNVDVFFAFGQNKRKVYWVRMSTGGGWEPGRWMGQTNPGGRCSYPAWNQKSRYVRKSTKGSRYLFPVVTVVIICCNYLTTNHDILALTTLTHEADMKCIHETLTFNVSRLGCDLSTQFPHVFLG